MAVYVMGVDPGFSGAIAFYDASSRALADVFDMPIRETTSGKKQVVLDLQKIAQLVDLFAKDTLLAVIEDVASRPEQGVASTFRFGYGAGALAGVVAANLIAMHMSPPSVWKAFMGLSSDKKLSCIKAQELFPDHANKFQRVKDNGRAEAALLAKFGERLIPLVQKRIPGDQI